LADFCLLLGLDALGHAAEVRLLEIAMTAVTIDAASVTAHHAGGLVLEAWRICGGRIRPAGWTNRGPARAPRPRC
jgi:hypothetical protein